MVELIEHYVPNFIRFTKNKEIDLILRGINIDDEEYLHVNAILTIAVQSYIILKNRFSSKDFPD